MRVLLALLVSFLTLTGDALAQKPEVAEVDAWLVRDAQMSSQFAVADALGYFKAEGVKVNPRWYIAGTDDKQRRHRHWGCCLLRHGNHRRGRAARRSSCCLSSGYCDDRRGWVRRAHHRRSPLRDRHDQHGQLRRSHHRCRDSCNGFDRRCGLR